MITAWEVAAALPWNLLDVVHKGAPRPVLGVDIADSSEPATPDPGDLVLTVGFNDVEDFVSHVDHLATAGVVVRRTWADSDRLRQACADAEVTLLALAEGVTWSVLAGVLRTIIDASTSGQPWRNAPDQVYVDLFGMADTVSAILQAPVTIEDASSRIVAYSTGQEDVDEARMASIFGRRVPRPIRDHFRSLGTIRRLASSAEPFYVPADGKGIRGRYIIPVRVGHEWLGSVWALTDAAVPADRAPQLRAATELIALHLLRMRAQGELAQQIQADRLRSALRGGSLALEGPAGEGPWRVAVLCGPGGVLETDARRELWLAVARRNRWRQPLVTDFDGRVYAVLTDCGTEPGSLGWLSALVRAEGDEQAPIGVVVGGAVSSSQSLEHSRLEAEELDRLDLPDPARPVRTVEDSWSELIVARALDGLCGHTPVSPLQGFVDSGEDPDGTAVATLEAVIDHWGEPKRAARRLGVHPNTVRYRLGRLTSAIALELDDPLQRLALRLEITRMRAEDPASSAKRVDPS